MENFKSWSVDEVSKLVVENGLVADAFEGSPPPIKTWRSKLTLKTSKQPLIATLNVYGGVVVTPY